MIENIVNNKGHCVKHILAVILVTLIFCTSCLTNSNQQLSNQESIDEYRESIIAEENMGGTLVCKENSVETTKVYQSCTSFENLRNHGCFGLKTIDMIYEHHYAMICQEKNLLEQASVAIVSYFDPEPADWWKSIPAEIIPMQGGIYTEESAEKQKLLRENLVAGKLLGDLDFVKLTVSPVTLDAVLSSEEIGCGTIDDLFHLEIALLADFDGDGIAELLLKGFRVYRSESCFLGSGNNLGAEFRAIVNRDSLAETPSVIIPSNTE